MYKRKAPLRDNEKMPFEMGAILLFEKLVHEFQHLAKQTLEKYWLDKNDWFLQINF